MKVKTSGAYLARVGTYAVHRSDDATAYTLTDATGVLVGTYATAQKAMNAGVTLISASYGRKRA